MKIWVPNSSSGVGISIRAAINGLLNWHKAERTQTAARKKNVPQIMPGWDYRPKQSARRHAVADAARAETPETLTSTSTVAEAANMIWFDSINPNPAIGDARTKAPSRDRAYGGSMYD